MEKVIEFVEFMVKSLTSKPDQVKVNYVDDGGKNILQINADKEDYGKIIGRDGIVVDAIRTLVVSISKDRRKWVINVPTEKN